jgi:hypothetical protein
MNIYLVLWEQTKIEVGRKTKRSIELDLQAADTEEQAIKQQKDKNLRLGFDTTDYKCVTFDKLRKEVTKFGYIIEMPNKSEVPIKPIIKHEEELKKESVLDI